MSIMLRNIRNLTETRGCKQLGTKYQAIVPGNDIM